MFLSGGHASDISTKNRNTTFHNEESIMEKYEDGMSYLVGISELIPSKAQPRKYNCPQAHEELKRSIIEHKALTPILYTVIGDDKVIVDGHRRWEAHKDLGLENIRGIYISKPSPEVPLIVNLIREDLLPMEKAEALKTLKDEHGYSNGDIARLIGKSAPTVTEMLKLNDLPDDIKEECRKSKRYVYSRLLEIAYARNDRARRRKFKAYKDELDGKVRKRVSKGHTIQSLTSKIEGLIKTVGQLERGIFTDHEFHLLAEKIHELNRVMTEKDRVISGLGTSEVRSTQCFDDVDENSVQQKAQLGGPVVIL